MQKEMVGNVPAEITREPTALERIFNKEVAGMPLALIACAISAVIFGGLVAMSAGG